MIKKPELKFQLMVNERQPINCIIMTDVCVFAFYPDGRSFERDKSGEQTDFKCLSEQKSVRKIHRKGITREV